jgi:hypothetical protein
MTSDQGIDQPRAAAPAHQPRIPAPAQRLNAPAPAQRPNATAPAQRLNAPAPAQRPNAPAPAKQPNATAPAKQPTGFASARRTLAVAGTAHALHDGYTDLIYVLLPLWQAEFGLGYGMLAALRGLYAGTMAALQIPSGWLVERMDGRIVLAIGTALAAAGYALAGLTGSLVGLCAALAISGAGSRPVLHRHHRIGSDLPVLYGVLGDWVGASWATAATAIVALAIFLVEDRRPVLGRDRCHRSFSLAGGAVETGG